MCARFQKKNVIHLSNYTWCNLISRRVGHGMYTIRRKASCTLTYYLCSTGHLVLHACVWEIKDAGVHSHMGSPSGQCHMAYIGTLEPLIFPRTMAQNIITRNFTDCRNSYINDLTSSRITIYYQLFQQLFLDALLTGQCIMNKVINNL